MGANDTLTGANGQFVLHFPELQPGEDVTIDVSRKGWVVVNDVQLKRALPADAKKNPLEILIARAAEREVWALRFYRLQGERVVDAQYKRKLAELGGRNAAGAEERERLLLERDQARAQIDELARQLAVRPVGSGGEDYQKAASLFFEGRINEALEILSEERLNGQPENRVRSRQFTGSKPGASARRYQARQGISPTRHQPRIQTGRNSRLRSITFVQGIRLSSIP
jgi:hypothetical protein